MFEQRLGELDIKLHETFTLLGQMQWLRQKLVEEFTEMQEKADDLHCYTDADLAGFFQIKEGLMGSARRNLNLPHFTIGTKPRYTREQAREITRICTVNSKGRLVLKKAA